MRDFVLTVMESVVEFFKDAKYGLIEFVERVAEIAVALLILLGWILIIILTPIWIVPYLFYRNHKQN